MAKLQEKKHFKIVYALLLNAVIMAFFLIVIPLHYEMPDDYVFSIIYIADKISVKGLKISNLHRREYVNPVATLRVREESVVEQLMLDNITTENHTQIDDMPLLENFGEIKNLYSNMIFADGKQVDF